MPAVGNPLLQCQLHQFLGGRRHILKSLAEGNHRESHAFQVLDHLYGAPPVKSDLPDIEPFPQALNEFLNIAIMHHIPLCGLQEPLPLPHIIGDMIPAHPQIQRLFRDPEIREQLELLRISS